MIKLIIDRLPDDIDFKGHFAMIRSSGVRISDENKFCMERRRICYLDYIRDSNSREKSKRGFEDLLSRPAFEA